MYNFFGRSAGNNTAYIQKYRAKQTRLVVAITVDTTGYVRFRTQNTDKRSV